MERFVEVQGVRVPRFIYGSAWKEHRTEGLIRLALEVGLGGIDTANQRKHYFEAGVGAAIVAAGIARDELFLQTKFTYVRRQDHRLPYDPRATVGVGTFSKVPRRRDVRCDQPAGPRPRVPLTRATRSPDAPGRARPRGPRGSSGRTSRSPRIGEADGKIGPVTRAAIADAKRRFGMPPTGRAGQKIYRALGGR